MKPKTKIFWLAKSALDLKVAIIDLYSLFGWLSLLMDFGKLFCDLLRRKFVSKGFLTIAMKGQLFLFALLVGGVSFQSSNSFATTNETDENQIERVETKNDPEDNESDEESSPEQIESPEGDTYNFYFQKSDSKNEVEQGKTQKVKPSQETEGQNDAKVARQREMSVVDLQLGAVQFQEGYSGILLAGHFNLNKSLGIEAGLLGTNSIEEDSYSTETGVFDSDDGQTSSDLGGGFVGLTYSPLSFGMGNNPVRLFIPIGFMLLNEDRQTTVTVQRGVFDNHETSTNSSESHALVYTGIGAMAHFSKSFGVVGQLRLASEPKLSSLSLGVVFSL